MFRSARRSLASSLPLLLTCFYLPPPLAGSGFGDDPIFSDSFELGDLCDWSSAQPPVLFTWYEDQDGDGFGDPSVSVEACRQPSGFVADDTDCDDGSAETFPGAAPLDFPSFCLRDVDDDDYGDATPPAGVGVGTDCDDDEEAVNPGATEICNGVDDNCASGIDEGFDVDGDTFSTCEGDCDDADPEIFPGAPDPLDGLFLDENCDGSDGELANAVFVSTTGVDANNDFCLMSAPCRTVSHAQGIAANLAIPFLFIQAGTYSGVLQVQNGLTIAGGFDTAWVRADRNSSGHLVRLSGGYNAPEDAFVTLIARSDTASFHDLFLSAPDATTNGDSSQCVHAESSTLTFQRVTFEQGDGRVGSTGTAGSSASSTAPATATDGGNGSAAVVICSTVRAQGGAAASNPSCASGTAGGAGGDGGSMDSSCPGIGGTCSGSQCNPTVGLAGDDSPAGTSGGAGGALCQGTDPEPGSPGAVSDGVGATQVSGGFLDGQNQWHGRTGNSGSLGLHGTGGGGGGGAGGCDDGLEDDRGASGGGGGAGGCRAPSVGGGGGGGGGSFGIVAISSSITVQQSVFERGAGGDGGAGGIGGGGQPGGDGGPGGLATVDTNPGGAGGDGGRGGHSGGGGGGAGGKSCAILSLTSAITTSGNTTSGTSPGQGGAGGVSPGNDGATGGNGTLGVTCTCASAANC